MQAGWQNVQLVTEINCAGSKDCNGEALWQLLKHLQNRQNDEIERNASQSDVNSTQ
jgi:hypothetical protein